MLSLTNTANDYRKIILKTKAIKSGRLYSLIKFYYYKFKGKHILAQSATIIKGLNNISTGDLLTIGLDYFGFVSPKDVSFLNIRGKLITTGLFSIGRGCRFDIGEKAVCELGANSYVSPFTDFIIAHGIRIGSGCAISWHCQFLDEDFHEMEYEGKIENRNKEIIIADNVWIGCYVNVFKGTFIAKGCVVAANAVVSGRYNEENCLIAGNPAKVIKKNISWK